MHFEWRKLYAKMYDNQEKTSKIKTAKVHERRDAERRTKKMNDDFVDENPKLLLFKRNVVKK